MNIQKIVGLVAIALAVVSVFVGIPQSEAILLVLGLYLGYYVAADIQVRVLASALVLNTLVHTFDSIPMAGHHLVMILSNVGVVYAGIAVAIILRNLYLRLVS